MKAHEKIRLFKKKQAKAKFLRTKRQHEAAVELNEANANRVMQPYLYLIKGGKPD